ncbi:hypothetical protein J2X16_002534 [Pelomonas aquatica]|uniref:Secreted protein n=1 Tax=Pelomonas aquatica TaxID=431058 RepID=A0ABU1Z986_9BURK|nr:hypothetical protein [Pelomonas aquatica]MDR7297187.1 hypothetical protein [Pelomonas aquatica]
MGSRPLAWLMAAAAAAGLGALALGPAAPPAAAPAADAPAAAPTPVLQMIGLAAPTAGEASPDLRADIEALAGRWRALPGELGSGSAAERALWQHSLARLQPWLERQPQALWLALPRLGEPAAALGQALVSALLSHDTDATVPQLEALAGLWPERATPLYEALLHRWADQRQHPRAVQALARAPLDAPTKERLQQALLARWAEAAPEQAARWALATPGQAALLAPLHDRWLQQDARSATVFASTLPRGQSRQALLDEGLSRWTAQDGPGARDWLRSMAPLAELDAAIARYASADELARHAPLEAMDLVARIATPERRWQAWQALARNLHDIDPGQVEPLLARAPGLYPAERARLLDELR